MKTSLILSPIFAIAVFVGMFRLTDGQAAERDGYSIEVKVTPQEGEARITEVTGIALENHDNVELPLTLSHLEIPATVSFRFELAEGTVLINIEDFEFDPKESANNVQRRDFFDAYLFFELGEERVVCTMATETISFTVTAPPEAKAEQEGKGALATKSSTAVDIKQLEVVFHKNRDRSTIFGSIYNPTDRQISQVIVRVKAPASGEFKGVDRRYLDKVNVGSLSDSAFQIDTQLPALPEGVDYEFALESAR